MKKLLVSNLIIMICFSAFMLGYSSLEGVSFADTEIEWQNCTTAEEQAEAFKAYCKSNDVTIEGSIADGVTSFTTQTYQNIVNKLGLDINALQADIKKSVDSNGNIKYLFNVTGVTAMNRIFSQFLQDHELSVGDSADEQNNEIYSGYVYKDRNGNGCLVFLLSSDSNMALESVGSYSSLSYVLSSGTKYLYDGSDLNQIVPQNRYADESLTFPDGQSANYIHYATRYYKELGGAPAYRKYDYIQLANNQSSYVYGYDEYYDTNLTTFNNGYSYDGFISVYYLNNKYYLCTATRQTYTNSSGSSTKYGLYKLTEIHPYDSQQCIIFIYSPSVQNNNYTNNNYTVINNDGDVYNYDTDDEPDPDTPVTPPSPDEPSGGTPPDDWDIELPDLSNTDWIIYGLEKKFPWDIPFNMMFILSLLNTEPVTPHFEGTIDLKVCQWNYDLDLSPFDTIAGYVRDFLFLGFIIGLMLMTKNLIWG